MFSLVESVTDNYIAVRISDTAVQIVMKAIRAECEDRFADVFKRITADNGSEFEDFS